MIRVISRIGLKVMPVREVEENRDGMFGLDDGVEVNDAVAGNGTAVMAAADKS